MRRARLLAGLALGGLGVAAAPLPARGASTVHPSLLVGFADDLFTPERSGGVAVRATLLRPLGATVDVGLDGGWCDLGSYRYSYIFGPPAPDTTRYREDRQVWHAGGVLRVHAARSRLRPGASVGLAVYGDQRTNRAETLGTLTTSSEIRPGFNIGAGLEYGPVVRSFSLALEAAWHFRVVVLDDAAGVQGIAYTILLGVRRR